MPQPDIIFIQMHSLFRSSQHYFPREIFFLICTFILLNSGPISHADTAKEKRIALVIGNGDYDHIQKLSRPKGDANEIVSELSKANFSVIEASDADLGEMKKSLKKFKELLLQHQSGKTIALFYYSGFGIQFENQNFLIPTGTDFNSDPNLQEETIPMNLVFETIKTANANLSLLFFDCCRRFPEVLPWEHNSPRLKAIGLAAPRTEFNNALVFFAAAPDSVSINATDKNSHFTSALLKHLPTPKLELNRLSKNVMFDVYLASEKEQRPWYSGNLLEDFFFVPNSPQIDTSPKSPPAKDSK